MLVLFVITLSSLLLASGQTISAPYLLWQYGSCYSWGCQSGWYSSPAFYSHPTNTSKTIVVIGLYSLFGLDGDDGSTIWEASADGNRIWSGVVYAEKFTNNMNVIIAAKHSSKITIITENGELLRNISVDSSTEFRSIAVGYINKQSPEQPYIIVGQTGDEINTYVFDENLELQANWPQKKNTTRGYAWGVYNDNIGLCDMDGDGYDDIVIPSGNY